MSNEALESSLQPRYAGCFLWSDLQHLIGVAEISTDLVLASPFPVCLLSGLTSSPYVHITCGRTLIIGAIL